MVGKDSAISVIVDKNELYRVYNGTKPVKVWLINFIIGVPSKLLPQFSNYAQHQRGIKVEGYG